MIRLASAELEYAHLARLTDNVGLFEHALFAVPRIEHGYCVDDVARGLLVAVRDPEQTPLIDRLTGTYLRFLESAIQDDGRAHNRMNSDGVWTDATGLGDWWGRAIWALGTAATMAPLPSTRARALRAFASAARQRSPHLRSMTFAAIGGCEVLSANPQDRVARSLLADALAMIPGILDDQWRWPQPRLTYGNASLAEALIFGGTVLEDRPALDQGLEMLEFLLELESAPGHLSVTGTTGRGKGERGPLFDQQPIEVAAIADACARAFDLTGDPRWISGIELASAWFHGHNDSNVVMFDPETGAGFDGLERNGRNQNRGAESTLAALSTLQHAGRLALAFVAGR